MTRARRRLPAVSVMLVEDDDGLRPEIAEYLHRRHHHVIACASLAEARQKLETALTEGTPPGAVLCDIGLQDGNGLDFYIAFAHRLLATQWILMSGSHDTHRLKQEFEKLVGLRIPQVVEKPVPLKALGLLVQEMSTHDKRGV